MENAEKNALDLTGEVKKVQNITKDKKEVVSKSFNTNSFDIDRFAIAVSQAETGGCKKGSAKYNNCFGIIRKGKFVRYETKEDSFKDFKNLWTKYYGGYPTYAMAKKYTGGDRIDNWLRIIAYYYKIGK